LFRAGAVGEKGVYEIPGELDYKEATVSCALHCVDRADIKVGEGQNISTTIRKLSIPRRGLEGLVHLARALKILRLVN